MNSEYLFIESDEQLSRLCDDLMLSTWLAVDTEFERVRTYYPELCLVQISNGEIHAVIDPLVINDLHPLYDLLYQESITKVLHSAHQDLEIFFNIKKNVPVPLFDTQIAAPLFGYAKGIGYGNLVKEVLGVELDKGHARTNWKKRPLSDDQLRYAVDDVIYLAKVYETFVDKMKDKNLHDFSAQIERLTKSETYEPSPDNMWKKIFAAKRCKGKQLDIIKKLAAWREITARVRNRPRKWILENHAIIEMAKTLPKDNTDLLKIDKVTEKIVNQYGEELLNIIHSSG